MFFNTKTAILFDMKADATILGQVIISLGSIASVILTAQKFIKNIKAERDQENEKILQKAMDEIESAREMLEVKLDICFDEIDSLKELVEKDVENIREMYEKDIKNLNDKVNDLREEVRNQNNQILALLSKLISG
jgi:uncharacterized protein YaaR (DUF327 family)